jgi:hypothetical protein
MRGSPRRQRRLPECEPVDGQPLPRGLEGQARAGGHPDHARRSAHLGEDGVEVLDLPLDRIGRGVATLAAPAAVVVDDLVAVGRQQPSELARARIEAAVRERAGDQDDRRSVALTIERDLGAVGGDGSWSCETP